MDHDRREAAARGGKGGGEIVEMEDGGEADRWWGRHRWGAAGPHVVAVVVSIMRRKVSAGKGGEAGGE